MAGGKVISKENDFLGRRDTYPRISTLTFSAERKSDHTVIICPVTGLTLREKALLKSSWKRMYKGTDSAENYQDFCVRLTLWILDNIPNSQKMFKRVAHLSRSELEKDPLFVSEIAPLIPHSLNNMIQSLYKPEYLYFKMHNVVVSHIRRLGRDHCLDYFEPLADKFPLFVVEYSKVSEDSDEYLLWAQFFSVLVRLMIKETENMRRQSIRWYKGGCCEIL